MPACLVAMVALPAPAPAAWPWMAVSIGVHLVYFSAMSLAYRGGQLAPLYALMRGTPPLLVALVSAPFVAESLSPQGWVGIVLLCAGLLSLVQGRAARGRTLAFALLSAACTATYTILDGLGSRKAGFAPSYVVWHGALQSAIFASGVWWLRRQEVVGHVRANAVQTWVGGTASIGAYALALWAMGRAPVAMVAALRETSVVFAALLGVVWLREPLGWRRGLAALLVATGAAVMHL